MTLRPIAIVIAIMLMTSTAVACGEETRMQASIQEVKQKHEERLMAVDGVVSVGIGRDDRGQAVIFIGLDHERPEARAQLPERLEGFEVRTEVTGKIRAR
jgi:hypothetical protein